MEDFNVYVLQDLLQASHKLAKIKMSVDSGLTSARLDALTLMVPITVVSAPISDKYKTRRSTGMVAGKSVAFRPEGLMG